MTTPKLTDAELLTVEECDAWYEYLASTQEQHDQRYDEVEPWAWNKLQTKVRAIDVRRRHLGAPA
jgi:hypothetical protein